MAKSFGVCNALDNDWARFSKNRMSKNSYLEQKLILLLLTAKVLAFTLHSPLVTYVFHGLEQISWNRTHQRRFFLLLLVWETQKR